MGKIRALSEIISEIECADLNLTIFAEKPWKETSKAMLIFEEEIPVYKHLIDQNHLEYFLEVFILKDFLEDWVSDQCSPPTLYQICSRLIAYAINDA